jgi:hypothetical protein|tara:strand:- start:138 stop:590 length:453 start_codon:yes stop_codon:yes gene_type:complete
MYLKLENGNIKYPYTTTQLKSENPNTSFPAVLTNAVLETFDVYFVESTEYIDDYTKNIEEGTPILSNSSYIQVWNITDATQDEILAKIEDNWVDVRIMRDTLLSQSDWTQFQDSPLNNTISTEWQLYRQSLRDVTSQSNPFNLKWPSKPM